MREEMRKRYTIICNASCNIKQGLRSQLGNVPREHQFSPPPHIEAHLITLAQNANPMTTIRSEELSPLHPSTRTTVMEQ